MLDFITQQQKIEEQGVAIQSLVSSIGTPLDSKGNAKRNWMNVAIAVGEQASHQI